MACLPRDRLPCRLAPLPHFQVVASFPLWAQYQGREAQGAQCPYRPCSAVFLKCAIHLRLPLPHPPPRRPYPRHPTHRPYMPLPEWPLITRTTLLIGGRIRPSNTRGCTKQEIREIHEVLLARPMGCIQRRRCRDTERRATHTAILHRLWALWSMLENFRECRLVLFRLLGQAASPSPSRTMRSPLVQWIWEDRRTPRCMRDAKSYGQA